LLPEPNSPFPPKDLQLVFNDLARWSAWWGGSAEELSRVYGGDYGTNTADSFFRRQNGQAGLVGMFSRFFWGERTSPGEKRTKLHVPLASEIAQVSADLLFGQPPSITSPDDTVQARLDELLADEAGSQLHEAAETCAALGQVYLRVGWDRDVDPDNPLISSVDADAAFPRYAYGRLQDVVFVREWAENGIVLRHLEWHEPGYVWHAAYLGDERNLGRIVPLDAHPETADLSEISMIADDSRDGSGISTGIDRLDVVGIKNARSRTWRHLPTARDLGRADISGVEQDLDALDDVWSSWLRDIRHGRSRLHVPAHMLDDHGRGKGATADLDRELYVGLNAPPDGDLQLTATQFAIRYEEHRETARSLIERIVSGSGYSLQTFGMDLAATAQTATESWARQIRTQHTRNGKLRHWNRALLDLTQIVLEIDVAQFGSKVDPTADIEVHFADTVSESQLVRAQTAQALRAAEAASTRTLVELVNNDKDGEWQDQEVQRIETGSDSGIAPEQPPAGQLTPAQLAQQATQGQPKPADQSVVPAADQPAPGQ